MDRGEQIKRQQNPAQRTNILSKIVFAYTFTTFRKGFKKDLEENDIPEHLEAHTSKALGDRLEEAWFRELKIAKSPSLWRAIARVYWLEFSLLGLCLLFIELVIRISQPIALSQLITFYTYGEDKIDKSKAYMYAGIIVGASFFNVLANHSYLLRIQELGLKLRISCCSVIYRKSLRLSKSMLGGTTIGQMVNLISNDVNRCDRAVMHAHQLWVVPLETVVIICLLWHILGPISTIGVLFMLGKKTSVFRLKTALKTDERVRLMNEIVSGIQVIKMYTWERPFAALVAVARRLEIRYISGACYIKGILLSLTIFTSSLATFFTILAYVLLGNVPTAEYVFVVISFYNILKQTMSKQFPLGITALAESRVSISRIQKFLLYDEIETKDATTVDEEIKQKLAKVHLQMQNASAKWVSNHTENTLNEINFVAKTKELVAIIGPVGSGKSSLLHVILKELPVLHGTVQVQGKLSYASQEPWIFAGTIKQNILFGQSMIPERYREVLRVCALERDLERLPFGDESLVGERGVTLSGGQKARVNLARAVYKEADIYLLDDPLSAVDTHVGKQLFDECISKFLKTKIVILVTHQLQYLQNVTSIFLIENGKIAASGSYEDIRKSEVEFAKQLHEARDEQGESKEIATKEKAPDDANGVVTKKEVQVELKEQKNVGNVSREVYKSYFRAGGSLFTGLMILLLFIATQASVNLTDYFLTSWVNMEQIKSEQNVTDVSSDHKFLHLSSDGYLYIYSTIVATTLVLTLLRSLSFFRYCMKASINLHNDMFSNVVHTPMLFFNTNSSGRILNRFSKDMGAIDESIPVVAMDLIQCVLTIVGVTVMISLVKPWLLAVTIIITTLFYILRIVYMKTCSSVKRLEGITRSPVFTHISASLQGLTTIRAFEAQIILQNEFDRHQDLHSTVWFLFVTCSRAFAFWLDLVCVCYIGIVTFSFFLAESDEYGGNVGLAITQALSLTGTFQWSMRQWSGLENQMTSVERVMEYTKVEPEVSPKEKPSTSYWPEEGNISFSSVSLRYSPKNPYVLKQLSFTIKSNEKIGIVGRTGAGKSSLIYALFQLAKIEGVITIDNIDIIKICLESLRSKISIIPQEPVLFSGTLRKNLEPFEEYSDVKLWNALEEVELKKVVAELSEGLNHKVAEGGSNFSVGQKQLVCLARAIVKRNKIMILDEATANVDPHTDALIQKTVRRKFLNCTVLIVAHRLNTIMDSDRVLVMDAGIAAEFDHPYLLLKSGKGLFYTLVQQTGSAMAEHLTEIAEKNYKQKISQ